MNLLISYSLVQSTAYPTDNELDDHLHRLMNHRNQTLEQLAKQDLEAAELLGKMLSGYASLRHFYSIRDGETRLSAVGRQQAATALISVIASSDDNIRGGLYDHTRDGIVSEDFLLALLGEALVFVSDPGSGAGAFLRKDEAGAPPTISLSQIDTLLKAIEDLEAVGPRVYMACDEFLQLVMASAPGGLKGSTPADLMRKSTASMSASFVLSGSSMLASQLQKSLSGAAGAGALGRLQNVKRSWDWRNKVTAGTTGEKLLERLRKSLAKDLAGFWLAEADGAVW
jgi:hypothetical protein